MFYGVTLEMSLKPFKKTDEAYMRAVAERLFDQWRILIGDAKEVSVLLWTADGSEILDWHGDFAEEMEWGHYVGGANNIEGWSKEADPERIALHSRCYDYVENPPRFTYDTLRRAVAILREVGERHYPDKRIRIGETFDPGPEFAKSDFKYNRHTECCRAATMGAKSFVCCYTELHADTAHYAGFPDGIPEGTPFGTFFGRQCQRFLTDMGFDYLWLSNGFGFGMETWSTTGAVFDGKDFDVSRFGEAKEKILGFWRLFRAECPDFRVETRGTNLSVGIDLATDGVPLKDIYEGGFNLLPPPNSPWAALDGDFGLEIGGYMSRIAQLPDERYLFRYYVHDPWWANSPWADRYEALPHDIYLPMAVCRLNEAGVVTLPTHLNILSTDNSFGDMPDFCAYEPSMHIQKALRYAPDAPPPVLWVYPFEEYHTYQDEKSIREMFFGDWFIRGALNHSVPMSGVVSTDNFVNSYRADKKIYDRSVLVTTVPVAGSAFEHTILEFIENGGKAVFYGSVDRASEAFLRLINVTLSEEERFGAMAVTIADMPDRIKHGQKADTVLHRKVSCGGGVDTVLRDEYGAAQPFVWMDGLVAGTASDRVAWLKGTCSAEYVGGHLLTPDDEEQYCSGESLLRYALGRLGYDIRLEKEYPASKEPVIMLSRHDNAFMFSVCAADTTVRTRLRFPLGAPLLLAGETMIDEEGFANYSFSRAELRECRVFVQQEEGVVGCHDISPGSMYMRRRIKVSGLKNATVRFLAPKDCEQKIEACLNSRLDFYIVGDPLDGGYVTDENGTYYEARNVTGELVLSVPFEK